MRFIVILVLLAGVGCKNSDKTDLNQNGSSENFKVKDLEVFDFEEFEHMLHKTDGQTYVINFWATWCAPCVKELPYFEKLNAEYADKNVKVILVSLDFPNQYDSKLKPYIRDKRIKSQVVALNDPDSNSWIPKVDNNWSGALPATLIYNNKKRVFYEQAFDYAQLENALHQLIK